MRTVTPNCDRVRDACSALVDGEDPGMAPDEVAAHLGGCPSCREFDRLLRSEGESAASVEGTSDPDFVEQVVRRAGAIDRAGVWWGLRALLVAVAVGYVAAALPEMLFSNDPHHGHIAHHLGIFEAAYAVTLVFVAVRPARARALVPFTVVLAVGMAFFAVFDVVRGEAFPLSELSHVLELVGLVLVWLLATRRGWPNNPRSVPERGGSTVAVSRPRLAVVEDLGHGNARDRGGRDDLPDAKAAG